MNRVRISQPMVLFALISGGVHAAVLVLSPSQSARVFTPGQAATSLQVKLTTSNVARASSSRPARAKKSMEKKSTTRSRDVRNVRQISHRKLTSPLTNPKALRANTRPVHTPNIKSVTESKPQIVATRQSHAATHASALSAANLASRRNQIRARLQRELAAYFQYPYTARRRGWHGQVILGVSILPSGQISRVAVQHSSGHPVLDEAALSAMHHVTELEWAPALLQGDAVEIQLPVIYRLLGG